MSVAQGVGAGAEGTGGGNVPVVKDVGGGKAWV